MATTFSVRLSDICANIIQIQIFFRSKDIFRFSYWSFSISYLCSKRFFFLCLLNLRCVLQFWFHRILRLLKVLFPHSTTHFSDTVPKSFHPCMHEILRYYCFFLFFFLNIKYILLLILNTYKWGIFLSADYSFFCSFMPKNKV